MAQVGTVEVIATLNTSQYMKGATEIDRANDNIEGSAANSSKKMNSAFNSVAKVGIAAIATAAVAAGVAIVKNIGGAIDRIDTLVAFPRVLQALGVSSDEAESATEKLAKQLRGLPTALGAGAKGVQGFVTSGLDVDKATRAFLGFNNAMLAASVETGAAQGTMQQLNQALSRGRIDGAEWNSIAANIPTVLQALQNETGKSKDELRELFREDPQALVDNIIRLNEEGGGGLASLDKQARDATGGISTAFANLNNSIQRGMQGIVESIGGGDLEAGQKQISDFISNIGKAFGDGLKTVGDFVKFVIDNKDVITPMVVTLGAFVGIVTALATAIKIAAIAQGIFNAVFAANPIGLILTAIAALIAGLIYFFTQTELGKDIFANVMKFIGEAIQNVGKFFADVWKNIQNIWSGVTAFFTGIGEGISGAFNAVIDFFKKWGITILAVIYWPFSLLLGLIIKNWAAISAFFTTIGRWLGDFFSGIWNGIVAVFTPVVEFYAGIFTAAFNIIKTVFGALGDFFSGVWQSVVNVFSAVVGFYKGIFTAAWDVIKSIFSGVASWFLNNVWNPIVNIFKSVGSAIGNAIGDTFKSVVNGVLRFAVGMINKFIDGINTAIDIVNNIPGVDIGKLGRLPVPQLAEGGIVSRSTLAVIGEGSEPEAVIPLSKLDKMLSGEGSGARIENNIGTINIGSEVDGERWLRRLNGDQEIVSNGLVPAQSYM